MSGAAPPRGSETDLGGRNRAVAIRLLREKGARGTDDELLRLVDGVCLQLSFRKIRRNWRNRFSPGSSASRPMIESTWLRRSLYSCARNMARRSWPTSNAETARCACPRTPRRLSCCARRPRPQRSRTSASAGSASRPHAARARAPRSGLQHRSRRGPHGQVVSPWLGSSPHEEGRAKPLGPTRRWVITPTNGSICVNGRFPGPLPCS